jgi:hypothetical protein
LIEVLDDPEAQFLRVERNRLIVVPDDESDVNDRLSHPRSLWSCPATVETPERPASKSQIRALMGGVQIRGLGGTAPGAGRPFPGLHWTGDDTEERVRFEAPRVDATHKARIADGQLGPKVMRFELELAVGGHERRMLLLSNDEIGIEGIAASDSFAEHRTKVRADRRKRVGREPEAIQLRMVAIAARAALEDPLR